MGFINFHASSVYSFENSLIRVEDLAGSSALSFFKGAAIADPNPYGFLEFAVACRRAGVMPVYALEVRCRGVHRHGVYPVIAVARTRKGLSNLFKLWRLQEKCQSMKPRRVLPFRALTECREGLFFLTGEELYGVSGKKERLAVIEGWNAALGGEWSFEWNGARGAEASELAKQLIEEGQRVCAAWEARYLPGGETRYRKLRKLCHHRSDFQEDYALKSKEEFYLKFGQTMSVLDHTEKLFQSIEGDLLAPLFGKSTGAAFRCFRKRYIDPARMVLGVPGRSALSPSVERLPDLGGSFEGAPWPEALIFASGEMPEGGWKKRPGSRNNGYVLCRLSERLPGRVYTAPNGRRYAFHEIPSAEAAKPSVLVYIPSEWLEYLPWKRDARKLREIPFTEEAAVRAGWTVVQWQEAPELHVLKRELKSQARACSEPPFGTDLSLRAVPGFSDGRIRRLNSLLKESASKNWPGFVRSVEISRFAARDDGRFLFREEAWNALKECGFDPSVAALYFGNGLGERALIELLSTVPEEKSQIKAKLAESFHEVYSYPAATLSALFVSAWERLLEHDPAAFFAAAASLCRNDHARLQFLLIDMTVRHALRVHPLSVNESGVNFRAEEGGIRPGLSLLHHVGGKFAPAIVRERAKKPYTEAVDTLLRLRNIGIGAAGLGSLVKSGALDGLGLDRECLFLAISDIVKFASRYEKHTDGELFTMEEEIPGVEKWGKRCGTVDHRQKLLWEMESCGLVLSGHPMELGGSELAAFGRDRVKDLRENEAAVLAGWMSRPRTAATGYKTAGFADETGVIGLRIRNYFEEKGYPPEGLCVLHGHYNGFWFEVERLFDWNSLKGGVR